MTLWPLECKGEEVENERKKKAIWLRVMVPVRPRVPVPLCPCAKTMNGPCECASVGSPSDGILVLFSLPLPQLLLLLMRLLILLLQQLLFIARKCVRYRIESGRKGKEEPSAFSESYMCIRVHCFCSSCCPVPYV